MLWICQSAVALKLSNSTSMKSVLMPT
jgi:hypothetical protein